MRHTIIAILFEATLHQEFDVLWDFAWQRRPLWLAS